MTIKEKLQKRIDNITVKYDGDDECQHSQEDELKSEFIHWIAETGTPDQRKLAKMIIKVEDMDFARWCA